MPLKSSSPASFRPADTWKKTPNRQIGGHTALYSGLRKHQDHLPDKTQVRDNNSLLSSVVLVDQSSERNRAVAACGAKTGF